MRNLFLIIVIVIFVVFGFLLSLISMYSAPDEQVHILEASYFWIGDSIAIFGLFYYLKK
ncbi:MAG: hypothetical protein PHI79_03315 [Sulfurovaceae bacterium]|nr:hypothetical protein [Sulfurovaceae bacterium]MDD5548610.1 hypothetical protein [Sulfurovaceae bacterium]